MPLSSLATLSQRSMLLPIPIIKIDVSRPLCLVHTVFRAVNITSLVNPISSNGWLSSRVYIKLIRNSVLVFAGDMVNLLQIVLLDYHLTISMLYVPTANCNTGLYANAKLSWPWRDTYCSARFVGRYLCLLSNSPLNKHTPLDNGLQQAFFTTSEVCNSHCDSILESIKAQRF